MLTLLTHIFHPLLKNFRFYRCRLGGTWYSVRHEDQSGFDGPAEFWQQKEPEDGARVSVIKTESYPSK